MDYRQVSLLEKPTQIYILYPIVNTLNESFSSHQNPNTGFMTLAIAVTVLILYGVVVVVILIAQ